MAKLINNVITRIHVVMMRSTFVPPEDIDPDPLHEGIGRHFRSVGVRLNEATKEYARQHPEIPSHA